MYITRPFKSVKDNKKKSSLWKYIFGAIFPALLIIISLVFIYFTQEQNPDPASEKIIRNAAASEIYRQTGIKKDPNDLTDEDFAKITEFIIGGTFAAMPVAPNQFKNTTQLSDIKLLEKFTNLQKLQLIAISFSENRIPAWMKVLAKCGILDLDERFAIDLSPLEKLADLQILSISYAPVKNIKPLGNLKNLQKLDLGGTFVSNLMPIRNLKNLKSLDAGHTKVTSLEPLKGLTNLIFLNLRDTKAIDLESLKDLINLRELYLSDTQVSDIEPLKGLINLKLLDLSNCKNVLDKQVEDLQKALPDLKIYR